MTKALRNARPSRSIAILEPVLVGSARMRETMPRLGVSRGAAPRSTPSRSRKVRAAGGIL